MLSDVTMIIMCYMFVGIITGFRMHVGSYHLQLGWSSMTSLTDFYLVQVPDVITIAALEWTFIQFYIQIMVLALGMISAVVKFFLPVRCFIMLQ
jgi:hypothetical protein